MSLNKTLLALALGLALSACAKQEEAAPAADAEGPRGLTLCPGTAGPAMGDGDADGVNNRSRRRGPSTKMPMIRPRARARP